MSKIRPRSRFSLVLGRWAPVLLVGGFVLGYSATNQAAPSKGGRSKIVTSSDDTTIVYGPQRFTKIGPSNQWMIFDANFEADSVVGKRYQVELAYGGFPTVRVFADSQEWIGQGQCCFSPIDIGNTGTHMLSVWMKGQSGSWVDVRVVRINEPEFAVFPQKTYVSPGIDSVQSDTFSVPWTGESLYVLRTINGSPDGSNRITNATVKVNATPNVLSPSNFGTGIAAFRTNVSLLQHDTVVVTHGNTSGKRMKLRFTATDRTAPHDTLTQPPGTDTVFTKNPGVRFAGSVTDETPGALIFTETTPWLSEVARPPIATPGAFSDSIPMTGQGRHRVRIQATNSAKLTTTQTRWVVRDTVPPTLIVAAPADTTAGSVTVVGSWADSTFTTVCMDGDTIATGYAGSFTKTYALDYGTNRILFRATDRLGSATQLFRYVTRKVSEPNARDSVVVPSALTVSGVTPFREGVQFLYTGGSPIQVGTVTDSIKADLAGVLRGRVIGRDFVAMPMCSVQVLGRPEFGYTLTRQDGRFDLVVNGGTQVVLRFAKPNFLEAQRAVDARINDYVQLDDVGLVGRTARMTVVDLTQSSSARGRFASDANGDRDLRMVFPPGVAAQVVKPSGGTATFSNGVRVRATEFTVGGDGPASMPGVLPPTSAYTYCVDMRLDEADSLGTNLATTFTDTIGCYVRDFMHLPVGSAVPAAYYDSKTGKWKGSRDGIVLKIIGTAGDSMAVIDSDADTLADAQSRLDSLGIDANERKRLKAMFAVGDTLWRVPVDHFSPWDLNFNQAASIAAGSNAAGLAENPFGLIGDACLLPGAIIECENRVLGERIPLVGTPYSLNYRSFRSPGDQGMRTLRVPITGDTIPTGLKRVIVELEVSGQRLRQTVNSPAPNETPVTVVWDGKDAYGRRVEGSISARLSVGYEYDSKYAVTQGGDKSFNDPTTSGTLQSSTTGDRAVGRVTWNRRTISLGSASTGSAGLGGWTLSPHHFFDATGSGTVYYGDGSVMLGDRIRPTIRIYGGLGNSPCNSASLDEQLINTRDIYGAGLAIGPQGDLYIADNCRGSLYRVGKDRRAHRIAGNGTPNIFSGPGTATSQTLEKFSDLALAGDGSVYFTSVIDGTAYGNNVVARVTPGGQLEKLVGGTYVAHGGGDGGPASLATIGESPQGIAVGPDGSVFFADNGDHDYRVRRIAPNGIITTYAGSGVNPSSPYVTAGKATSIALTRISDVVVDGDGVLYLVEGDAQRIRRVSPDGMMTTLVADFADFFPSYLGLAPDGSLYFTSEGSLESNTHRIWRRDPEGTIGPIAGGGVSGSFVDGGPAGSSNFRSPCQIVPAPDGSYYFIGRVDGHIYRVARTLETQSANEFAIPSPDGSEIGYFDSYGRHLRTRDALTGGVLRRFEYDAVGRLTAIYDANNDTTRIIRDGNGVPQSIVAPYGQTTSLTLVGGYLHTVANPNSETYTLTMNSDSLLQSMEDPEHHAHTYAYTGEGRLYTDTDPVPATTTLAAPSYTGLTRTNTIKSGENRETSYSVTDLPDGTRQRRVVAPGTLRSYSSDSTDARKVSGTPDGTVGIDSLTSDPRFGMTAPILARSRAVLPSQEARVVEVSRPYDPQTFSPPFVTSGTWKDEVRLNSGSAFVSEFDAQSRTLTTTTPEGRITTTTVDSAGRPTLIAATGLAPVVFQYDSRGRLAVARQNIRIWTYGYDAKGRLGFVRDTLHRMTRFGYDNADRVTQQTLPDAQQVSFGYDLVGNLTLLTPPAGYAHGFDYTAADLNHTYTPPTVSGVSLPATTYDYDKDRALTRVVRPDGSVVSLRYNAAIGRLDSVTTARGRTTLTYDDVGRVQTTTSPDAVTVTYGYDGPLVTSEAWGGSIPGGGTQTVSHAFTRGLQDSTQAVNGSPISYTHDGDGLLTGAGPLAIHRRADNGLVDSTSVANGGGSLMSSLDYDSTGDVRNIRYRHSAAGVFFQQSLKRDSLGRVIEIEELSFGVSRTLRYRYDMAGRLYGVRENNDTVATYRYDANGNRQFTSRWSSGVLVATDTATFDHQDRLLSSADSTYGYTAAGELQRKIVGADTTTYRYDALGNLNAVRFDSGDSATYAVDGMNRRVGRRWNGLWTGGWLYQNAMNVAAELDSTGAVLNRYVYGEEGNVPTLLLRGSTTYRLITDHIGSVRGVVNVATGVVVQRREYDDWGVMERDSVPGFQTLGYAGGLTDPTTSLVRFGARDYSPTAGRWTVKDPILFKSGDTNPYQYALATPVNASDPAGLGMSPDTPNTGDDACPSLSAHVADALSVEALYTDVHGKSFRNVIHEADAGRMFPYLNSTAGGPQVRYIIDPGSPGIVIDVRHFLVVGKKPKFVGNLIEELQAFAPYPEIRMSAHDPQDYYSNQLGRAFYRSYDSKRSFEANLRRFFEARRACGCP